MYPGYGDTTSSHPSHSTMTWYWKPWLKLGSTTKPLWLADPGCKSILRVSEVASAGEDRYATEGAVSWSGTISGCMFIYTDEPPLASTSFFDIHYIYTYIHTYIYVYFIPFIPLRWLSPAIWPIIFSRWSIESYLSMQMTHVAQIYETDSIGMLNLQIFLMTVAAYIFFQTCSGHHWPEARPVSGWSKRSDPGWGSL